MYIIWQIFFNCSIKSPKCTDKYSKKIFSIAITLPSVLMYQKRQISLLVGYKTTRPKTGDWEWLWRHFRTSSFVKNRFLRHFLISYKNALLYHFLAYWLAHNENLTEKSVFCEAWSPEMTSQSFPVSCFCTPPEVTFDAFGTSNAGMENRYEKFFLLYLSVHWGYLIEQIKTNLSYTLYSQRASRMNAQLQTFIKYFIHRFDFSVMKWFFEPSIAQL